MDSIFSAPPETWQPGTAPVAVVMISLNEAHNMEAVLRNLSGWAQEVFLVDSYSADETVDIALRYGVHVVQRKFKGFGDQWNFALNELPIKAPWTMKLDPDERLTENIKSEIINLLHRNNSIDAFNVKIRLFFMGTPLPKKLVLTRLWRTGVARFSNVLANEHAIIDGNIECLKSEIEHYDSPNLHHWVEKQNRYTTAEAVSRYRMRPLSAKPNLFGSALERRMWLKHNFYKFPFRYTILYMIRLISVKPWKTGYAGFAWARLRVWTGRMVEYKLKEMNLCGKEIFILESGCGSPNPKAIQAEKISSDI